MNVPTLRFKEFTDSYKKMKYKDVLKIKSGKDQKQIECKNGKYPILGTSGKIGTTNMFLYNKPSVLIGRKGTINKPQYMETPFWTVDTLFYSQIYEPNIPKYLFYSFQNVNWQKYDESTGVPSLSSSTIESVECFMPSMKEQIKVSNFLSLLDKKMELQTKKIEALKLFKKGLNQKMFSESGEMRCIGEYIEEYTNKTTINNQYPILSSTFNGMMIQNEYFNKQAASLNNVGYKILPRNYITYRSMSDTGEFRFNIQNIIDVGIVSPAYPVFKVNNINSYYFLNYINESCEFKTQIISIKEGGTRFALNFNKFKNLKIKIIDNIETYGNLIRCLNIYFLRENEKLIYLNKLKKGFIQNMFI